MTCGPAIFEGSVFVPNLRYGFGRRHSYVGFEGPVIPNLRRRYDWIPFGILDPLAWGEVLDFGSTGRSDCQNPADRARSVVRVSARLCPQPHRSGRGMGENTGPTPLQELAGARDQLASWRTKSGWNPPIPSLLEEPQSKRGWKKKGTLHPKTQYNRTWS